MTETALTNARIVLEDAVMEGTVALSGGAITSVDHGRTTVPGAVDCEGDLLMPGPVELHTDNLERHIQPRPGVDWPHAAAILAHDRELASCGITTVFDALRWVRRAPRPGWATSPTLAIWRPRSWRCARRAR